MIGSIIVAWVGDCVERHSSVDLALPLTSMRETITIA
jgi:hypothetical protein